jgi:ketose-bisphosphate aldolase
MGLVSGHAVIQECTSRGLVAGAFNTTDLETTLGIVRAIERTGVPTFIQVAPTNVTISGYEYIHDMVARRLDDVRGAIAAKFTSVMLDAAEHPLAENIALSSEARALCPEGVSLEAELGSIGGKEDEVGPDEAATTNPAQVAEFVDAVRCDMLAVSVGNVHGYSVDASIDFELLERVQEVSTVPLVIHGGSGLPAAQFGRLADYGVVKVNIASDLRNAMIRAFGEAYAANPKENSLIKVSTAAVDAVAAVVEERIRMFNPRLGR